jgi:hypothetical protein
MQDSDDPDALIAGLVVNQVIRKPVDRTHPQTSKLGLNRGPGRAEARHPGEPIEGLLHSVDESECRVFALRRQIECQLLQVKAGPWP